jgi:dTDP-glucose 4,6-dehydratase
MRIVVTGGLGFIGHHLVEHILVGTDWNVVIVDNLSYAGSFHRLLDMHGFEVWKDRVRVVLHDLQQPLTGTDEDLVGSADYAIHLAAQTHVDHSIANPGPFVASNMVGTYHLLEWARRQTDLQRLICVSTDEVYGPAPDGVFFKETDPVNPSNPYAATKVGADALAMAYRTTYRLPVVVTRTMNNFGERQHREKLIPRAVRCALVGEPMPLHADLTDLSTGDEVTTDRIGSRTWLHARNHADALVFLLDKGDVGPIVHVSGNEEHDNRTIVRKIEAMVGKPIAVDYVDFHKTRPGHDRRYALDGTKLQEMGWTPPVAFDESLARTVSWYVQRPEWLGL